MRCSRPYLASALVLVTAASFAADEAANRRMLARIIADARTDGERAVKLLEAARKVTAEPELRRWLLERCYEYGLRDRREAAGYRAAEQAVKELAAEDPSQAAAHRKKLYDLYGAFYRLRLPEAYDAAWGLSRLHLEDGDADAKVGRLDEALGHYRKAMVPIRLRLPDLMEKAQARVRAVSHRKSAARQAKAISAKLDGQGQAPGTRDARVLVYLRELGDPAAAEKLLEGCSEALRTYVPLAAKDPADLAEAARLDLARWYVSLSAKGSPPGRAICLLAARDYYHRFLAKYAAADRAKLEAEQELQSLRKLLRSAGAGNVSTAWLAMGRDFARLEAILPELTGRGIGAPPLGEDVKPAVRKAVAFLLSQQRSEGSWPPHGRTAVYRVGPTALACSALVASGVPAAHPRMVKALDWMAKTKTDCTYGLGLRAHALMLAERQLPGKYLPKLRVNTQLLYRSTRDGSYGYHCLGDRKGSGCNSNSQFALWGVYCGSVSKVPVPSGYWSLVLRHWLKHQKKAGGWGYRGDSPTETATMTAAGLASLAVCRDRLQTPPRTIAAAEEKASQWLSSRYAAALHAGKQGYFLYTVVRACTVAGRQKLGGLDWYALGKKPLLDGQAKDGSWVAYNSKVVGTGLCLLFLTQGRRTYGVIDVSKIGPLPPPKAPAK